MAEKKFLWGAATASFQIEGGVNEGGRGPCIWDAFCRTPGRVVNMENGDIACDSYHRYPEDIALMKRHNIRAYRFSISWSRVLPSEGVVNPKGIAYYSSLVDELLKETMGKLKNPAVLADPAALQEAMEDFKYLKETQGALNDVLKKYGFGNVAMNV